MVDLTAAEFIEMLRPTMKEIVVSIIGESKTVTDHEIGYGLKAIEQLFNCSQSTASRIKKGCIIAAAITQPKGRRTFQVDMTLARELMNESDESKSGNNKKNVR